MASQNQTPELADLPIKLRHCWAASGFPMLGLTQNTYNLGSRADYMLFVGKTAPKEKGEENGLGSYMCPISPSDPLI